MRKIIKHKVFDTSTADFICNTPQGILYKKRATISFFLCATVGADTTFTPITWREAERLVHDYGTQELYQRYFTVNTGSRMVNQRLSESDYSKLRILAGRRGMSIGQYLHTFINQRYKASAFRERTK